MATEPPQYPRAEFLAGASSTLNPDRTALEPARYSGLAGPLAPSAPPHGIRWILEIPARKLTGP